MKGIQQQALPSELPYFKTSGNRNKNNTAMLNLLIFTLLNTNVQTHTELKMNCQNEKCYFEKHLHPGNTGGCKKCYEFILWSLVRT